MLNDAQLIELERELGSRSLRAYLELIWHLVEPARGFKANYHHDMICDHLEAVTRGDFTRLVINVPPGSTKSILCSVAWPTWTWTRDPGSKWITASYSERIATRDAKRSMQLMEHAWWQARWGHLWEKNTRAWTSKEYRNSKAGIRYAVTVSGGVTGEHADYQLIDDPIKPLDARGARVDSAKLSLVKEWWDETMSTRMADPATCRRVLIMQRLHESDLSAHMLNSGDYVHLNIPMVYEPKCCIVVPHQCSLPETDRGDPLPPTPLGYKETRKEGECFWEERFSAEVRANRKKELGTRGVAAQDQQRPMPSGGGIFKRDWIQHYEVRPKGNVEWLQSWDCTFKGLTDSDYVVGQVWIRKAGLYYLVDQVRAQMSVSATIKAIVSLSAKWPKATRKLIEDKANGPAVISLMQKKLPGLIAVNPEGGKIARAQAIEPVWESGNVWIPDPTIAPWVHDFVEELVTFNGDPGRHDDQVDAMTQALVYLHKRSVSAYMDAWRKF